MRVLTVVSSVLIPLTLISGVEGTNFAYLPEPAKRCGYRIVLLLTLAVALGQILYFK
jgi:magnesium transporter